MGWDVKLTKLDGTALGGVDSVKKAIVAVLPGTRFDKEPGGDERIAAYKAQGIELPEALRSALVGVPQTVRGEYQAESDGLLMQFNLGVGPNVKLLRVMVKGDNELAEALLTQLANRSGWSLSNYSPSDEK